MKRKEKKRHKKPKINFWLKLLIVLAAAAGIYLFASSSMFDVTAYEVEGNSYYTDEEILVMGNCKTGGNIFWGTDCGDIKERLEQNAYMEKVNGISKPKVGLVNIGIEDTKGRELEIEAYKLLKESELNFCGNLEARELPKGEFEVAVTDGFTGNVILKLYEGMGSFFSGKLKEIYGGLAGKLSAMLVYKKIKAFKKAMDYTEEGGAVLLGVNKPVIKAHGSSDSKAFYNAIRQAKACVDGNVTETIIKSIEK